jgi:hypothetical protein
MAYCLRNQFTTLSISAVPMNPSSQPTVATTILLDRQKLLYQLIHADVCTDCSITAYEARTSTEAIALAQSIQPDVILLDLGTDDLVEIAVARQRFDRDAHLALLLDPEAGNAASPPPPSIPPAEGQTQSVKRFVRALRQACSELIQMEPDMIHHTLRTWHQHALESPGRVERPAHRRLKILVFVVRECWSSSKAQSKASALWNMRSLVSREWPRFPLNKRTVEAANTAVRDRFSYLLHFVEERTPRLWRTV